MTLQVCWAGALAIMAAHTGLAREDVKAQMKEFVQADSFQTFGLNAHVCILSQGKATATGVYLTEKSRKSYRWTLFIESGRGASCFGASPMRATKNGETNVWCGESAGSQSQPIAVNDGVIAPTEKTSSLPLFF